MKLLERARATLAGACLALLVAPVGPAFAQSKAETAQFITTALKTCKRPGQLLPIEGVQLVHDVLTVSDSFMRHQVTASVSVADLEIVKAYVSVSDDHVLALTCATPACVTEKMLSTSQKNGMTFVCDEGLHSRLAKAINHYKKQFPRRKAPF